MAGKRRAGDRSIINGIVIIRGNGNVFADVGGVDPEERLAKSVLARGIAERCEGMTQQEIADRLEIDQPKVSALLNGRLRLFSTERLMTFVRRLGEDVEIHVRPRPASRGRRPGKQARGRLVVVAH